jgi:hypothetical protein
MPLLIAAILCACGPSNVAVLTPDAGSCPSDLPPDCPNPIPSYSTQVAPLISSACLSCHGSTSPSFGPLTEYAQVVGQRKQVLNQLLVCQMPPPPAMLTEAQRQILLGWLVCASPNN